MGVVGRCELVGRFAERTGLASADAARALGALLDCLGDALRAGEMVRLTGFGTFRVIETKERPGVNPQTKVPITIPPGRRILFSPSSRLRAVEQGRAQMDPPS